MIILRKQKQFGILSAIFGKAKTISQEYSETFEKEGYGETGEKFSKFIEYYDKECGSDDGFGLMDLDLIPLTGFDKKILPGKAVILFPSYKSLMNSKKGISRGQRDEDFASPDTTLYFDEKKKEWGTGKYTSKDFGKIVKIYFGNLYNKAKKDYNSDPSDPDLELRYEFLGNVLGWIGRNIK